MLKFIYLVSIIVGATVYGATLDPIGRHSCQYANNINLEGPDNGVPVAIFHGLNDPRDFDAWRYTEILICNRPNNAGSYAIVTDANHVANPPQEIVSDVTHDGYGHKLTLNTSDTRGQRDPKIVSGDIDLVIYPASNGNPENLWVFERNPNIFDGEPTLESSMEIAWGNWPK